VTVVDAPVRMGRRAQAKELLSDLPADLTTAMVEVRFPDDAFPTTSFVDELVRSILVDRKAQALTLVNANRRASEIATLCAVDLGVGDRLSFR
jgi:hypothetical protein